MKPNRRIALIAVAAIAAVGAWGGREGRRSPCSSGACRLPLPPTNNTWPTETLTATVATTNATPPQTTSESGAKP